MIIYKDIVFLLTLVRVLGTVFDITHSNLKSIAKCANSCSSKMGFKYAHPIGRARSPPSSEFRALLHVLIFVSWVLYYLLMKL